MTKETIYELESPYRNPLQVKGYSFGKGNKSACVVGTMRGNEVQQLYVCSQLINTLTKLEKDGGIINNNKILVIPSINHFSMNIGKRFWALDNTDINRMFPGYGRGETTQRIAAGVFEKIQGYNYGIQLASFYMQGDFIPHVRMMATGYQNSSLATLFGLQYVVVRQPRPYDTTTLNYNLQLWDTRAFSIYTTETDRVDDKSARQAVSAILRFLTRMGVIKYPSHAGYISSAINEDDLLCVKTQQPGFFRRLRSPGDEVERGDLLAEILHPYEGNVIFKVVAPVHGVVFFAHNTPMTMENQVVFKLIKRMHT